MLMVVDDETDITFTLKVMLEQRGFSVDVFNEPRIALDNFKPNYYELILLDVKMPQMNGFELYHEINKVDRNVKVCFLTAFEAYYNILKKEFPKLNGCNYCFIRKPIDIDCLVSKVIKAVEFK